VTDPPNTAAGRTARFEGQTALVTGGGRGIGRAIALALAAEGAHVGVVARSRDQCEAVAKEIGDRGIALPGDVVDARNCEKIVSELAQFGPPLSVLINAAGVSPIRMPAQHQSIATFAQIVSVNLVGAFTMTHAAADPLLQHGGAIVNIASTLGTTSSPLLSAYGASKAALIQLTRTLAHEWAEFGVQVNALCPGYVKTDLNARMLGNESILASILEQTPMRRLAMMHEVVAPALFLASDEASYITGAALLVDGGFAA
jgi:NAD(P)-dependent dehydrogenase (short-subunit alcohol dehydrogenase family)